MAMVTASATALHHLHSLNLPNFSLFSKNHANPSTTCFKLDSNVIETTRRRPLLSPLLMKNNTFCEVVLESNEVNEEEMEELSDTHETLLYSFNPLPLLFVAALPGAGAIRSVFGPFVELVKSWNLPHWLVHWGHPGNMAVVLFAMGGYGTYLGFRIRFSDDLEEKAKAKDLHPKLLAGMFFFFALGATGGVTSLLTSDKPILEREILDCEMFMGF
ncbi:uncharacterized protein LOC133831160 isoform X2 [Humulus lupulus]|uniref:uncharacterized protein LOC133831160 isoform X2 n=1 Tax=Humulus lupulus TaxID=3486 RepID=UPI002B415FB0|nr:uncharacterized protein LOC133831160 isoform X2 [Humulus lupulus]